MFSDLKLFSRKVKACDRKNESSRFFLCTLFASAGSSTSIWCSRRESFESVACVQLNMNGNKRNERQAANSKFPLLCPKNSCTPFSSFSYFHHEPCPLKGFLSLLRLSSHQTCSVWKELESGPVSIQLQKRRPANEEIGAEAATTKNRCNGSSEARVM